MVPTGLATVLSNVLFSLELTPPSIEIWPLRAIYRERGVEACHYFYDPTEAKPEFVVHFEGADEAHTKRAQKVIAHLA